MQAARRRSKKGKAMGSMILRIRKEIEEKEENHRKKVEEITGKVRYKKGSYRVVGIYVNGDMERKLEELDEGVKRKVE